MQQIRSLTVVVLMLFSLLLTSGCAWLDARQREIIYRPTAGVPADFAGLRAPDERYFVSLPQAAARNDDSSVDRSRAAQRVEVWWLPHADRNAPPLLYFH